MMPGRVMTLGAQALVSFRCPALNMRSVVTRPPFAQYPYSRAHGDRRPASLQIPAWGRECVIVGKENLSKLIAPDSCR
jgi:hypothetical protein